MQLFFLFISINNSGKYDLQVIQNYTIRFCKDLNLLDMVSIPVLHNSIQSLSSEQRRQKQLLKIIYVHAKKRSITCGYQCECQKSN